MALNYTTYPKTPQEKEHETNTFPSFPYKTNYLGKDVLKHVKKALQASLI